MDIDSYRTSGARDTIFMKFWHAVHGHGSEDTGTHGFALLGKQHGGIGVKLDVGNRQRGRTSFAVGTITACITSPFFSSWWGWLP